MSNPLVSICIPTYKQITYLKSCLDSVLMQNYNHYELIITDDTPDNSVELFLKEYLKNTTYTYQHNNQPLGSPKNWNAALQLAKGKYIKLLHHDDFFTMPNSLQLMVNLIEKEKSSFLFCETDVLYTKQNTHRIQSVSAKQLRILKTNPEFIFFKNIIGAPSATLCLNTGQLYDANLKWLVDIDFYIQSFRNGTFSCLKKPLISTLHDIEGQITGDVQHDKSIQIKEHVLVFNKIINQVTNLKPYTIFFDDLFYNYSIQSYEELTLIVPGAELQYDFYKNVIKNSTKKRWWKYIKKRFFGSRYNNYIFKMEQFI